MRSTVGRAATLAMLAGLCSLPFVACSTMRLGIPDYDEDMGSDGGSAENVGTISITPSSVDLTVSGSPKSVRFRAKSDRLGDITNQAVWSLSDGSIGSIDKGMLTVGGAVTHGGTYKVIASLGDQSGTASLNLRLIAADVVDPSAPANARDWFGGPSGGPPPAWSYPFDNSMMPPNVLQMVLQWQAASAQTVFRIHAAGPTYERYFYVGSSRCPGGRCSLSVDDTVWSELGHSALDQQVTLEVDGVEIRNGPVGSSKPVGIRFSPEDIKGGLYYFSPTITGIKRVPLGASKPVDFISHGDETGCAGCHAVSRDGKQVAVEFGSGQTGVGSTVVDGAMPGMRNFALTPSIAWNFAWFNPTADKLITDWNGTLTVRDPKNGHVLQTVPTGFIGGQGASMPEWSPDGRYIAMVREPKVSLSDYDFEMEDSGDIVIMPYNNGSFGAATELVHGNPGSEVHFWPSWSPDSHWLVFNSMTCTPGTCMQYNAATTRLRLIRAIDDNGNPTTGAQPIELVQGTHIPNQTNNWPKFAPFLQSNHYVFIVYSAKYSWGFNGGSGTPQLFMFGLDLDQAKKALDPSYQPIWLPFQDSNTGNHSAIWTTDVACLSTTDCPSEFTCVEGSCVPVIG